jgi:hypothetical protein
MAATLRTLHNGLTHMSLRIVDRTVLWAGRDICTAPSLTGLPGSASWPARRAHIE